MDENNSANNVEVAEPQTTEISMDTQAKNVESVDVAAQQPEKSWKTEENSAFAKLRREKEELEKQVNSYKKYEPLAKYIPDEYNGDVDAYLEAMNTPEEEPEEYEQPINQNTNESTFAPEDVKLLRKYIEEQKQKEIEMKQKEENMAILNEFRVVQSEFPDVKDIKDIPSYLWDIKLKLSPNKPLREIYSTYRDDIAKAKKESVSKVVIEQIGTSHMGQVQGSDAVAEDDISKIPEIQIRNMEKAGIPKNKMAYYYNKTHKK